MERKRTSKKYRARSKKEIATSHLSGTRNDTNKEKKIVVSLQDGSRGKKKPLISVCIPCFNDALSIGLLLDKILDSRFKGFEVLVLDDASTDETEEVMKDFRKVRYIKHLKNTGVGKTRNDLAKAARGEILLYFDADVLPKGDIAKEVADYFKAHPEVDAVTGFPGTGWENSGYFGRYKYWRDYSYWHLERDASSLVYFRPAVGAIKRLVFLESGGFPENYAGASIEDLEFSYRLSKIAKTVFDPKMVVLHPFGGFSKLLRTYFTRTYLYAGLLSRMGQFSGVATTPGEATSAVVAFLSVVSFLLIFLFPKFVFSWAILFFMFLSLQRKFLGFVLYKEGVFFWVFSIIISMVLYLMILAGAGWYVLRGGWRIIPKLLFGK